MLWWCARALLQSGYGERQQHGQETDHCHRPRDLHLGGPHSHVEGSGFIDEGRLHRGAAGRRVESPHRDLLGKTWSDAELSTVEVIKVVESYGTQRSIERAIHSRGQIVVPAHQFAFQGSVRDGATNIVHVFGYTRTSPSRWCWVTFDAASMQEHLNRRMQQLEDMKKRRPRP